MHFGDELAKATERVGAPVAIGLDPHLHQLPLFLQERYQDRSGGTFRTEAARAVWEFNQIVLNAVVGKVIAVKPQFAFYEQMGSDGWKVLEETCALAKELGLLIIGDAKRGDISSTGAAYAQAILADDGPLACDSITLNPWMGVDTLKPFQQYVEEQGKGIFVLLRTTNPESNFFQHHGNPTASAKLVEYLADAAKSNIGHSGFSNVGAVVGASAHGEARVFREKHPTGWFLVPGVGAQGSTPAEGLAGANQSGMGSIVVASRSLLFPKAPFRHVDFDSCPDAVAGSISSAVVELTKQLKK